jgi:hypothetical protein
LWSGPTAIIIAKRVRAQGANVMISPVADEELHGWLRWAEENGK